MIHTALATAALALCSLAAPAVAEIVPARCILAKFDTTTAWDLSLSSTAVEKFDCSFLPNGGNITVNSNRWAFTFLTKDQGTKYIRINTQGAITFTKTGQYSLRLEQS